MPERVELKHQAQLRIEVILQDGSHHHLAPRVLDIMLERDQVMQFKRSSGWVSVGVDPVRVKPRDNAFYYFDGWERRGSANVVSNPLVGPLVRRQFPCLYQL